MQFFQSVVNPLSHRQEFAHSPLVRTLWPDTLLQRTDAFFGLQFLMNVALTQPPDPILRIQQLHGLLTTTSLSTLPLWYLGPTLRHLQIADQTRTPSQERDYLHALAALANRRYSDANAHFDRCDLDAMPWTVQALHVYALCQEGRIQEARRSADLLLATATTFEQKKFLQWLTTHFWPR